MQKKQKNVLARVYASVFLSSICSGAGFVFMKNALDVFPTPWFIFWRFFISVLLLLPFLGRKIISAPRTTIVNGVIAGVLFFAATMIQSAGIAKVAAGKSAFINSLSVVLIPLIQSFISRKSPPPRVVVGCILCFIGMAALTGLRGSGISGGTGELMVLAGTCIFAFEMFFFKHAAKIGNPHQLSLVMFAVLSALSLPFALAAPLPESPSFSGVAGVLYAAVMMNICMVMVTNNALRYISPTSVSVISSTQAIYGAFFGFLLRGEIITFQFVLSGCAMFVGIMTVLSAQKARGTFDTNLKSKA